MTFATVRELALALPDVEEGTAWGTPAVKLRGRLLACMASHASAEPGTLAVRLGVEQRDAMLADAPEIYYLKPHYEGHACVLVRLSRIERDALKDLLGAAWRFVDGSAPKRAKGRARGRGNRRRAQSRKSKA
jgi:hypothetical protein